MTPDQVIKAITWAVASTFSIVFSFIWAQAQGTEPTTILLGAAGLIGLVGLIWRLVSDYRQTSELIDDYRERLGDEHASLTAEREENRRLREENRRLYDDLNGRHPGPAAPPV